MIINLTHKIRWGCYMHVQKVSLSALVICFLTSGAVIADDDTGWYIGVGVSRLDAKFGDKSISDLQFDDSDNAGTLKGGYMWTDNVGLEFAYFDLGDFTGGSGFGVDADAAAASLVLNWPVANMVDLYGKIGAFYISAKSDQFIPGVGFVEEDDDASDIYGSLGGEIDFGVWNIFLEYSTVDTDVGGLDIDIVTAGVKWEIGR